MCGPFVCLSCGRLSTDNSIWAASFAHRSITVCGQFGCLLALYTVLKRAASSAFWALLHAFCSLLSARKVRRSAARGRHRRAVRPKGRPRLAGCLLHNVPERRIATSWRASRRRRCGLFGDAATRRLAIVLAGGARVCSHWCQCAWGDRERQWKWAAGQQVGSAE